MMNLNKSQNVILDWLYSKALPQSNRWSGSRIKPGMTKEILYLWTEITQTLPVTMLSAILSFADW